MAASYRRQYDRGSQGHSQYREERDPERGQPSQFIRDGGEAEDRSRSSRQWLEGHRRSESMADKDPRGIHGAIWI